MHRSLASSSNLRYFVFSGVECSGTRVKDIKFVTGVEDIPDFNFLAHIAKGNVSFCHHLASVNFSHFNLLL